MSGAPRRIGRYEVIRPIAAGDTAELFLAKQTGLEGFERVVFIKRIRDELAAEEKFVKAFLEEARLVAKLSHPNIVEVYDLGKDGEAYFVAMEYVQGRTLTRVASRATELGARLTPPFVARCISEICAGLQFAHTMSDASGRNQRIVHGAISPRKVIVAFSGVSKLRDFGIAKAATILAETNVGLFKGRYAYLSPEQVKRMELDARSDVFALGILLYELLTGAHPFKRGNSILTLTAIAEEKHTPVADAREDLPQKLAEIVERALSKKRSKRFASAAELQAALEDYLGEAPRCDSVEIRRTMNILFEEELIPGAALLDIPGVGEVVLPESDAATVARKQIIPDDTTTIGPKMSVPIDADTEIAPFLDQDTDLGAEATLNQSFESETDIPIADIPTRNLPAREESAIEVGYSQILSDPSVIRDPAETGAELGVIPNEYSLSFSQSLSGAISDAFAEFELAPVRPVSTPPKKKKEEPAPLPLEALTPLEPDPPGTPRPKREIVEVHRPGPQAPTEFRSDLADQAAAILAGVEPVVNIPHLPSIIRVRADDDAPIEVVAPQVFNIPSPPPPLTLPPREPTNPALAVQKLSLPLPAQLPETAEFQAPRVDHGAVPEPIAQLAPHHHPRPSEPIHQASTLIAGLPPKVLLAVTAALLVVAFTLLMLTMRPDSGVRVNVRSTPPNATVTVNGQTQQTQTPLTFEGKPGATYQVRVEKVGFVPAYKTIIIPLGSRNVLVEVDLQK